MYTTVSLKINICELFSHWAVVHATMLAVLALTTHVQPGTVFITVILIFRRQELFFEFIWTANVRDGIESIANYFIDRWVTLENADQRVETLSPNQNSELSWHCLESTTSIAPIIQKSWADKTIHQSFNRVRRSWGLIATPTPSTQDRIKSTRISMLKWWSDTDLRFKSLYVLIQRPADWWVQINWILIFMWNLVVLASKT